MVLWQLSYQCAKKLTKIGKFLCSHCNIEDGRKYTHFWHIVLYYFKKGKNQLKCKKEIVCAVYGEGAVTAWTSQKWLRSFLCCWTMLHGWVEQLKSIPVKLRHWEQLILYHTEDSQYTQNIQINKVTGEHKKNAFILWKKLNRLFGQYNIKSGPLVSVGH